MNANQIATDVTWRNSFYVRQRRQKRLRQLRKAALIAIPLIVGFLIGRM